MTAPVAITLNNLRVADGWHWIGILVGAVMLCAGA
jgi:hypothetical protein